MSRFFRRIGVTVKKTLCRTHEQDRPDISRHRQTMANLHQGLIDPGRLVFIDETWTKTNMTRLRGWAHGESGSSRQTPARQVEDRDFPRRYCATTASMRPACSTGPSTEQSASTPMLEQVLVPTLKLGDVVVLDNPLPQRKGGAEGDPGMLEFRPSPAEVFPTSTPSSRSLLSSKLCCERRKREATKP